MKALMNLKTKIASKHSLVRPNLALSGILAAACLFGMASVSSGVTIVDPTAFSPYADMSTATPGVTLSTPGNGNGTAIYAVPFNALSLTGNYLGFQSAPNPFYSTSFTSSIPLRADFTSPASSVSVDFALDTGTGWTSELRAFDSGNNLLGSQVLGSGTGTISAPGISYILAYFNTAQFFPDEAGITRIEFSTASTAVPDGGSTLALLGVAVAALLSLCGIPKTAWAGARAQPRLS